MERFQTTLGPIPMTTVQTREGAAMAFHRASADYGGLLGHIEKHIGRPNGRVAADLQRRLDRLVFDLRKQLDRVLSENRRLLKRIEELCLRQDHLSKNPPPARETLAPGPRASEPLPGGPVEIAATPSAAAVDEEHEVIELLEEIVAEDRKDDQSPVETGARLARGVNRDPSEAPAPEEAPPPSFSLNTNFVLQDSRGVMMTDADENTARAAIEDALVEITTTAQDAAIGRPAGNETEGAGFKDGEELPVEPGGYFLADNLADGIVCGDPVAFDPEGCLEPVAETDTAAVDIIELKEIAAARETQPEQAAPPAATAGESGPTPDAMVAVESPDEPAPTSARLPAQPPRKPPQTAAGAYFERGKQACEKKKYAAAVEAFEHYLKLAPEDPRGFYNLAILHYRLKDFSRAAVNARKALALGYAPAAEILAKTDLRAAGDPPAPDLPQKTHAPSNRAAAKRLFDQGAQAFKKNAYHRAIERFNRFAALMPDEAKGHYNLAICYHRLNRGAKALTHAKRAAELGADAALKILPRIQAKMCPRPRPHTPRSADRPLTGDGDDPAGVGAAQIDGTIDARGSAAVWDADELGEEITQCAPVGAPEKYRQRARQDPIVPERAAGTGTGKGAAAPGNGPGDAVSEHFLRDERLKTIFDLGRSAVEDNEYFQAIQHFTTATHLAPQDPRGFYHLAEVSFRLRFYETAREHAKRAIELGSSGAKEIMSRIDALRVPA